MHYLLALVLLAHGLLHLAGFSKAFGIGTDAQIHHAISKTAGIFWLLSAFFLVVSAWFAFFTKDIWWLSTLAGIIISQVLVISTWHDAKYGTVINIIILLITIPSVGAWRFENKFQEDLENSFLKNPLIATSDSLLMESDIQPLPRPVQKYIRYTGALNHPKVKNFKVEFSGQIRKDEKSEWMPFTSVQYNFMDIPTRLFFMKATMKHFPITGYHAYENGSAFMDIRFLSLFNVQSLAGKEMGIAETVTFFNDMVCMAPATLIDKRIRWDSVVDNKVHASFTANRITVSAWLYFNGKGVLTNFVSNDRYAAQEDGTLKRLTWSTPVAAYEKFNGHQVVSKADAIYSYPKGDLCYGKFSTTKIYYNVNSE